MTLQQFRKKFIESINSPTFGEPTGYKQRSNQDAPSPASKELRNTKLLETLSSIGFCKTAYHLSLEHHKLEIKRRKVLQVRQHLCPVIQRQSSAAKHLTRCVQMVAEFNKKYGSLVDYQMAQKVDSARNDLEAVAFQVDSTRKLLTSNIHPKLRTKRHEPSEWELVFTLHDYPLQKLKSKAPDQWFLLKVDCAIQEFVNLNKLPSVSDMTRFKVIAAICSAAINWTVEPTAIKQFFFECSRSGRSSL